ncbi:MAG: DUF418 domain-containing protein [Myxococcota bacterium]
MFFARQYNYWGSLFLSLAYIGAIMLTARVTRLQQFITPISAAGRMALSNYLAQSILCTLVFYGHGLGYFGSLSRVQQLAIVVGIWSVSLIISPWWLSRYHFGPAEWFWRSLTYWRVQPLRRQG